MTICLLTNDVSATGGIKTFNEHFFELFTLFGHHVVMLTADSTSHEDDLIEKISGLFTKVTLRASYQREVKKIRPYFRPGGCDAPKLIAMGFAMRKWLFDNHSTFKIDIIEASDHGGFGLFALDSSLPPVVLTNHVSLYHLSKFNHACTDVHGKVIKQLELKSYQYCNAIFAHGTVIAEQLKSLSQKAVYSLPIPWKKNYETVSQCSSHGAIVVGQLQVIKGPILLAEALAELQRRKIELQIQWFGNDTKTIKGFKSVKNYIDQKFSSFKNKTIILQKTKSHKEILSEMASAKYIIVPSLWETFNYVALEAAALGKAIIITNTTGASSVFTNQQNALIINPNQKELADAIQTLENNTDLRIRLGDHAKKLIHELFSPATIVNTRIDAYNEILNQGSTQPNFNDIIQFLSRYLTTRRKLYLAIRGKVKKIFVRSYDPK